MTKTMDTTGYDVEVLGPLTVSKGGEEIDLGGPKQRLTLAVLIADIDSLVSTESLIERIWGDDPPATARKAVQVHISNLRRILGEAFPLRTAPGGYVIQSADLSVDVVSFEHDLASAKATLRTNPLDTERILTGAIARWRGSAYADLAGESALAIEITRLSELRLQALEVRVDGQLRIGRHTDVVGELATLCTEHPYRERFRELHMLALYRCGRQTEALRAYQRTRLVLVDELGIDPGPSLQALHQQILEQASELNLEDTSAEDRFAFVATDIEASTAMWEAEPEAMQRAVARHDEILADAVTANAGTVFKGTGDGIFAVFAAAPDALQAAVDAQQALHAEPWPTARPVLVRIGVDEGSASVRGDDYFGPALNRVSRVMSSGHGGQVLCPAELAGRSPVPIRQLGSADYKGVGRLDVDQLVIPGVPDEFPDLQTDRAPKTTLREGFGRAIRGYELRERLGEGAHGVVYRAYQAAIGREVAIKVIRPEHANRSEFVKRFEAEAQFVAQLEHPHIVSLYDYWRDPDGAYLVMQVLRGGSLAASLERAPWRPPAALQLLDQVGAALDYAHRQGVIHRDLKPANVLLDGEGNAYLSDFGIASHHVEAVGVPVGSSVAYVSPEELAGETVGLAADMYGLALLTYEILVGDRPALGEQPSPIADRRQDLPASLDQVLARATDRDPTKRFDRVDDFLRALRQSFGADVVTHRRRVAAAEVRNPYKGLRAFAETDAHDYFGRDHLVSELIDHVSTHRLTAVVGPSGSGKSSLVRAGLLPQIRRMSATGPRALLVTDMFPGSYPFEELEAALLRVAVDRQDGLLSELLADDRGLLRMSKQLLPDDDSELLLVIDQFEELFLLTQDDYARRQFLANLVTVASDERSRVRIVVTMRADHFDRPLADPDFGALLRKSLVPIAMPSHDELTRAIAQPAAAAGLEFEAGLIQRIVHDVADEPGALPLLQYALTELVRSSDDAELTVAGYERTGGVAAALTLRAEEIYEGFPAASREAAREVFLRLVAVDETGHDTRRRVRRAELDSLSLGESALDNVLDAYGSFRLLSFDRDPVTRGPTVEVAHEALIREWPRYRNWVDERREDLLLERRLEAAATEWDGSGREQSFLFVGGQFDQYERWANSTDVRLTAHERAFLNAAKAKASAAAAADRAQRARESQSNRRLRRLVGAVVIVAVVALGAGATAVVQRGRADREATAAEQAQFTEETRRLVAEAPELAATDRRMGLMLAAEAYERSPGPDTLGALQSVLVELDGFHGYVGAGLNHSAVEWLSDTTLVTSHDSGLSIYDTSTGTVTAHAAIPSVHAIAVDPVGELIAVASDDKVIVFDAALRELDADLTGFGEVTALAFAPGGWLAVGHRDGTLRLMDARTGAVQWEVDAHPERSMEIFDDDEFDEGFPHQPATFRIGTEEITFSDDGRTVATSGLAVVRLWHADTGDFASEFLASRSGDAGRVLSSPLALDLTVDGGVRVAFSDSVVTFTAGGDVVDDTALPRAVPGNPENERAITSIELTEDAAIVASTGGTLRFVPLGSDTTVVELNAQLAGIPHVASSPDGSRVAFAARDGVALMAFDGSSLISRVVPVGVNAEAMISESGELLIMSSVDRLPAEFFDVSSPIALRLDTSGPADPEFAWVFHGDAVYGYSETTGVVALDEDLEVVGTLDADAVFTPMTSRDGVMVGLARLEGQEIAVFDSRTSERLAVVDDLGMLAGGGSIRSIDFSPDGSRMMATDASGAALLWDTSTWEPLLPALSSGGGAVVQAKYTPGGGRIVTLSEDGDITIRDAETFQPIGTLLGNTDSTAGLSHGPFFQNDRYMITTADGSGRLWDLEAGVQIGTIFPSDAGTSPNASMNGRWLATISGTTAVLWDLNIESWPELACRAADRGMTESEWESFGPAGNSGMDACSRHFDSTADPDRNEP